MQTLYIYSHLTRWTVHPGVQRIWELTKSRGMLFNYTSNGLVFCFCFLKGRSIALGRERARYTTMNLYSIPSHTLTRIQLLSSKRNCVDDIKRKQIYPLKKKKKKHHLSVQNLCFHPDADLIHCLAKPFW